MAADSNNKYVTVQRIATEEVAGILQRGSVRELQYLAISVGMYGDDLASAQETCIALATHPDPIIRGNAIQGLGHLARRFRTVAWSVVVPLVVAAQTDPEEYVRFQANDALDDIKHYAQGVSGPPVQKTDQG